MKWEDQYSKIETNNRRGVFQICVAITIFVDNTGVDNLQKAAGNLQEAINKVEV